jgi:hypothetical protein
MNSAKLEPWPEATRKLAKHTKKSQRRERRRIFDPLIIPLSALRVLCGSKIRTAVRPHSSPLLARDAVPS